MFKIGRDFVGMATNGDVCGFGVWFKSGVVNRVSSNFILKI